MFFTVATRFVGTFLVVQLPIFRGFTQRERVFMALAWISKATTQAAFATVPLLTLTAWVNANPGLAWKGNTGEQLLLYGQQIQWCCVLSIFIGTPLGTVFMNNAAPFLLARADEAPASKPPRGAEIVEISCKTPAEDGANDAECGTTAGAKS